MHSIILIVSFFLASLAFGQVPPLDNERILNQKKQIKFLVDTISEKNLDLEKLQKLVKKGSDKEKIKKTQLKIDNIKKQLATLRLSLEEVATDGVQLSSYNQKEASGPFDWQAELLEIFKPMISELKSMTETPRAIDALTEEKNDLERRIDVSKKAVYKLGYFIDRSDKKKVLTHLKVFEKEWTEHLENLENRLKIVDFKLDGLLNPPDSKDSTVIKRMHKFFLGRGLTMIIAFMAFTFCFVFFTFLSRRVEKRLSKKPHGSKMYFQRAMRIGLQLVAFLGALAVTMLVLYARGDWFLLGFIFLFLAAAGWGLSQSLPRQIQVIKILMNIGSIREGERVIYQGVPWQVMSLNMFTKLKNPLLIGGEIKLPISTVADLISRKCDKNEAWFPSRKDDFILLDDGTYGKVISQSPSIVCVHVQYSKKSYATLDYLSLNPRNLSSGFGIHLVFGLDYALQQIITKKIPDRVCERLKKDLSDKPFGHDVADISCSFYEMGASSLDLKVVVNFHGKEARFYLETRQAIQTSIVELCSEEGWNIPFQTMTLDVDKIAVEKLSS